MAPKKKVSEPTPTASSSNNGCPKSITVASSTLPYTIRLTILAKPNSSSSQVADINDEEIGVHIAAPPKEGEANKELCDYISGVLGVSKSRVTLDRGGKSRHKILLVELDKETAKTFCKGKDKVDSDSISLLIYEKLKGEIEN